MKQAQPTASPKRLFELDVLRGIALLGILVVNMAIYAGPVAYWMLAGVEPFTGTADRFVAFLIDVVARGKFLPTFAFLFGLGASLQWRRMGDQGLSDTEAAAVLRRRFSILLVIGMLHVILVWAGDILVVYALFGLLVLILRRWPSRQLLAVGTGLWGFFVAFLLWAFLHEVIPSLAGVVTSGSMQNFFAEQADLALDTYAKGSFAAITAQRFFDYVMTLAFGWPGFLAPFALFLWGFVSGREGWLDTWLHEPARLRPLIRWTLLPGLVINIIGAGFAVGIWGGETTWGPILGDLLHLIGAPLLAVSYMGGIAYLAVRDRWRMIFSPFAAIGRMSLTHYLMQSLIATTLFYSYGWGLYGEVGPATGLAIAVGIFTLQLILSTVWLRRYRFGPVEWLWRSLTYGETQPMRRTLGGRRKS